MEDGFERCVLECCTVDVSRDPTARREKGLAGDSGEQRKAESLLVVEYRLTLIASTRERALVHICVDDEETRAKWRTYDFIVENVI